jgi:hypothetical protein
MEDDLMEGDRMVDDRMEDGCWPLSVAVGDGGFAVNAHDVGC